MSMLFFSFSFLLHTITSTHKFTLQTATNGQFITIYEHDARQDRLKLILKLITCQKARALFSQ